MNNETASPAESAAKAQAKKYSIWLAILLVGLIGIYAADLIPAFAGQDFNPQSSLGAFVWTPVFCALLWKRYSRNGWIGALVGLAVAFAFSFVAGFVRSYVQHGSIDYQLKVAANQINHSVPKMVDEGTRLDGAVAGPGPLITYRLTFTKKPSTAIAPGAFSEFVISVKKSLCGAGQLKPLMDQNVTIRSEYRGSDGAIVGAVTVDRHSCDAS